MNDDGILAAIIGYPLHSEVFDLVSRVPEDLEARFALISSKINQNDLTIILERLKVSKIYI